MSDNTYETMIYNLKRFDETMEKLASYNTDICPKCGEFGNPKLLELWGHCVECQNSEFRNS